MPNPNLNIDTYEFEFGGGGGGGTPEGITYVVDSSQKLNDWLTGVAGNDYTHVFIAPGRHVLDYTQASTVKYLDDVSIGTKTITGAPGSVICDDINTHSEDETHKFAHGLFGYQTRPKKECYIKNVTIEISKYCGDISPSYETGRSYLFYNCINIIGCNITAIGTYTKDNEGATMGDGAPPSIAARCVNIRNCYFNTGYSSADHHDQGTINAIAQCNDIDSCIFDITDESTYDRGDDDTSFSYVYSCVNISNCISYGTVSSHLGASPDIFNSCRNMTNIIVYDDNDPGDYSTVNLCINLCNVISKYFDNCKAMSHCCGFTISSYGSMEMAAMKFYRCYADYSGTVNIADTAAGGWNWGTSRW